MHVHVQCAESAAEVRENVKMKSEALGRTTLEVEVTNISPHSLWLLMGEDDLFLPFDDFPWFKVASVSAVLKVERPGEEHLYWPDLDVDLTLESIRHPERYPLVSRVNARGVRREQGTRY